MHAGESLWDLYGLITGLERKYGSDSAMLKALAKARNDLKVIGELILVPPPSDAEVAQRIPKFERAEVKQPATVDRPIVPPRGTKSMTAEGQAAKDLCTEILNDMDEMPEEAEDFAESVKLKVGSMLESIEKYGSATPKMLMALENMRHGQLKWLHRV
jgi:hypothetical protein